MNNFGPFWETIHTLQSVLPSCVRSMGMSFFTHALYIHSSGPFQNGAKPLGPEPFGSERLDMSSSTCLKAELLEAEGQHALVFYCSVHLSFDFAQDHELIEWHLFETPLNGPLFWAFDKKRHTHAPSQPLRPSFWR